ncbi:MAG TPA: AAA family ATPase [Acidimicrobiales bacterium]|jgi:DNA-binding CsgD family transcriptional regulator
MATPDDKIATDPAQGLSTRLVEREKSVEVLADLVAAVTAGQGRSLFLVGEAGIGKTALLHELCRMFPPGTTEVWAKGSATEMDLPFALAEQALGSVGLDLSLGPNPLARRADIHTRARRHLRNLARAGPVCIVLDDLHWSDPDSLQLMAFLARRLEGASVAIVGAIRPWPVFALETVDALMLESVAVKDEVLALSKEGSTRLLVERASGNVDRVQIDRSWELSAGNPLLVVEAARILSEEGSLPEQYGTGGARLKGALLLSHLMAMPEGTVTLLRAASILGTRIRPRVAQFVAGMEADGFAAAFEVALAAGILRDDGDGWAEFRHALLATAITEDASMVQRANLHARAFAYYEDTNELSAAVAHAVPAQLHGDAHVIDLVIRAAGEAMVEGAVETCLAHLGVALTLSGDAPADELLEKLADVSFLGQGPEEAHQIYQRLLRRDVTRETRTRVLAKATQMLVYSGLFHEAKDNYDLIIADCGGFEAAPVGLLVEWAHAVWELEGPQPALDGLMRRAVTAMSAEDHEILSQAIATYKFHSGDISGVAEVELAARTALHAIDTGQLDPAASFNIFLLHVSHCGALERFVEAERYVKTAVDRFHSVGALQPTLALQFCWVDMQYLRGFPLTAITIIDDLAEEVEFGPLMGPLYRGVRARSLVLLGRLEEAETERQAALRLHGSRSWYARILLDQGWANQLMAQNRVEEAADVYDQIEDLIRRLHIDMPGIHPWAGEAIEVALAAGRLADVDRRVSWLEEHSSPEMGLWPSMIVLGGRAALAAAAGHHDEADALYAEACEVPCPLELERARLLVRYGSWLRRQRQPTRARPYLAEALNLAEERGVVALGELARQELAAAGGRRRSGRTPHELTPQQRRVAGLVVSGSTNREIGEILGLSSRTVESHLATALLKLGVRTRAELRRRRNELGLLN